MTVARLVAIWETFRPQHDQTLVDQKLRFVDIHRPDGKPDVLQQIEHGRAADRGAVPLDRPPGARHRRRRAAPVSPPRRRLDADRQPDLRPVAEAVRGPTDDRSGTPDDRWVYMEASPVSNYSGIGALAAASRALRGFNDSLATECLALAEKAYAEERARPAPPAPATGFPGGRSASSPS